MSMSAGLLSSEWIEGESDGDARGDCLGGSWPACENGDGILSQLHHRQTEPDQRGEMRMEELLIHYKVCIQSRSCNTKL